MKVFYLVVLAVSLLFPTRAMAWDEQGHELIATMAFARLNPKAKQAVADLAREVQNPKQTYDAITLSCWMDDLRGDPAIPDHGKFLSWHYIDIGIDPGDPPQAFAPGDDDATHGNIVQALTRATTVLKGGTDPYVTSKAMACAMVLHLVGDIHQPLHCAAKYFMSGGEQHNDAGGNKLEVLNGPPGLVLPHGAKFNLHAFWDSAWRASFDASSGDVVLDPNYADELRSNTQKLSFVAVALAKRPPPPGTNLEPNFEAWAKESNQVARDFVYPELTATESKKECRLGLVYVARAHTLARQRLVLAAWRLATLLNETLGGT